MSDRLFVFLFFVVVVPFLIAGFAVAVARCLPPFIDYVYERGMILGVFVCALVVTPILWLIRYRYPDGDLEDVTPFRQVMKVAAWWWVGAIPSLILWLVIHTDVL